MDLGRVDVGVDDRRVGGERVQLAGHPVVEAGAERDDEVGLLERVHSGDRAVHPGHPEVLPVRVGERTAPHQRGEHRDPGQLGELAQRRRGAGLEHPAADVQHRPARGDHQPGRLPDLLTVRVQGRPVPGQVERRRPGEPRRALEHVLGDVHEDRTGPTGTGEVERLGQDPGQVVAGLDQVVVLGDRHRDAGDVGLLERIGTDRAARHLTGDRHNAHRVHVRVGDRGHQVRRARPRRRHTHPDPAGRLRIPRRRMPGALLVADQDMPDRGVEQRVVCGQDGPARDAEHHVHPERLQRTDEGRGAGHRLVHDRPALAGGGVYPGAARIRGGRPMGNGLGCRSAHLVLTGSVRSSGH